MNQAKKMNRGIEVVSTLSYPDNRLSDIVNACKRLGRGQAIEVHFEGKTRPETIRKILKQNFQATSFLDEVITFEGNSIMKIYPNGRTLQESYPARMHSINSVLMGATGNLVDPFNIRVEDISIEDIAHHLGRICRFNGAVTGFYSVADHCIKISNRASEENKLWGLLHDAAEAYLGDITRPVKQNFNRFVQPVEEEILRVIADKFGLPPVMPQEIIDLDNEILQEELELLEKGRLTGNPYYTSSKMFLMVFKDLTK